MFVVFFDKCVYDKKKFSFYFCLPFLSFDGTDAAGCGLVLCPRCILGIALCCSIELLPNFFHACHSTFYSDDMSSFAQICDLSVYRHCFFYFGFMFFPFYYQSCTGGLTSWLWNCRANRLLGYFVANQRCVTFICRLSFTFFLVPTIHPS